MKHIHSAAFAFALAILPLNADESKQNEPPKDGEKKDAPAEKKDDKPKEQKPKESKGSVKIAGKDNPATIAVATDDTRFRNAAK